MVFFNELGRESLNIYHKLRLQYRLTKYSFWKFGSSFFRRWHWYSKDRNIYFWTHICRNWIQQNQKSSRSNHFRFWKFWWLTKMSPIWQCHQKCDHWHEFLSESTPEAHSAPNNRLFAQTWSSIRNSRTKPIPGKIDKSRTDYPVSTQYHLDTSPGLDK